MTSSFQAAHPFVKWAGGKTQLLPEIRAKYPAHIERYCEPFVGGGAVLFDVLQRFHPREVLINDINAELINTYRKVQTDCDALLSLLAELQAQYYAAALPENKALFLQKRARYNELKQSGNASDDLEKAALFIFLNKTCFNGLYRVNAKGLFNVPFNSAKRPLLCDEENIRACSALLQQVQMTVGNYAQCEPFIDSQTFVYIDPPYRPLNATSAFTSYSAGGFGDAEQVALSRFIAAIASKGAAVVASNSDPKNADSDDTFFDDLYADFDIQRISAARMINSDAKKRGAVSELLISSIADVF